MSILPLKSFDTLVGTMAAAVQGSCRQLLDLTVGSVLRAVMEANASVALWMQWLTLRVLQTTRAATSTDADLDSWVADFGLVRLPGVAAAGQATFARYTPTIPALVPVGALVRSIDGTQVFVVTADAENAAWSEIQNGFLLASGVKSVDVPVQAQTVGRAGNVQAGAVALLGTAMPGVDTVSNAAALSGGADAEPDVALRTRFTLFLDTRSRATELAVANAIISVRQGLRYAISENVDPSGAVRMGHFVVTLDDGTGSPPSALLTAVSASVDAVRPIATSFSVVPPQVVSATVSLQVSVVATVAGAMVRNGVRAALISFIDALPIGAELPISRLVQVAYDADPAVTNVLGVTVNGTGADLTVPPTGLVRASSVVVS